MTEVIARIDDSLPGKPLYEIKLDRSGRITHVRMTTEPLLICKFSSENACKIYILEISKIFLTIVQ
jgi:hypothetical protein